MERSAGHTDCGERSTEDTDCGERSTGDTAGSMERSAGDTAGSMERSAGDTDCGEYGADRRGHETERQCKGPNTTGP
ncbi:unnamed protein product [Ranitomeya imitator]|uniref:Uncharacterized protein n=1 Tax=Ranitomeya imitator TaxID=111125 RepID=A0ABN9MHK2_9NEOB|nr:unnamed protein product [Ranitomeya imitator]